MSSSEVLISYSIFSTNSQRDLLYFLEQGPTIRTFNESHKHTVCKDGAHDYYVEQCDSCSQEKHGLKISEFVKPTGRITDKYFFPFFFRLLMLIMLKTHFQSQLLLPHHRTIVGKR